MARILTPKTFELHKSTKSLRKVADFPSSKISAGEGNGTPLQYSCLENPMDGGAW